ncbi:MAG TPA: SRPBCC family protein [Candidatus Limnocylindria bacterium]|nr:SRPBCC family protein [Candidatus Limnocylindria bacterium]
MAVLTETIETTLGIDEAFAFVGDFANSQLWDPGVASSVRADSGEVRVGSAYNLAVRVAGGVQPMTYTVTHLDPPRRVVLAGEGAGVKATDDIRFTATESGTRIDYTADIQLVGVRRLLAPFAGGAFRKIAENARDGMQRALDERAATAAR